MNDSLADFDPAEMAARRLANVGPDLARSADLLATLRDMAEVFALDVRAGYLAQRDVVDTLVDKADAYGLTHVHGRDTIERIVGDAFERMLRGKPQLRRDASLAITSPALAPSGELETARASDIPLKPIEWLWPSRIAIGKQALIAGEAGLGKSQVSVSMAVAITTGGEWPAGEGRAPMGSVIILSAEDGAADTIVPRLLAAGAALERVHIVNMVRQSDSRGRRAFNLQSDLALLERKIAALGDVRMVLIDPISSYLGAKVDSHVNAAVRSVLEPIGEMAERTRVAVVSITHPPKGAAGGAAINQFIGSIAFVAAARSAFMVMRDPDDKDRRLFLPVKNNLAPLGKALAFRLEQRLVGDGAVVASAAAWEREPVDISADAVLQAQTSAATRIEGREAEDWLRDLLSAGPAPVDDIKAEANALGHTWSTLRRAKQRLGVAAVKLGMEAGWAWELPKALNGPEDAHS